MNLRETSGYLDKLELFHVRARQAKPFFFIHAACEGMGLSSSIPTPAPGRWAVSLWHQRRLVALMVRRDIATRYRGSLIGVGWSLLTPMLLLAVYTFVFSVVFNARWGGVETGGRVGFAMSLFAGLLIHGFFSECLVRAPTLILSHANLVKKVVFPLEILPVVAVGSALFGSLINVVVLLVAMLGFSFAFSWTVLLIPLMLLPLVLMALGMTWFVAALGVYLRDVAQVTGMLSTLLLFMAPVFYPQSALPPAWQPLLNLNPLTFIIESTRAVTLEGRMPDWTGWTMSLGAGIVAALVGYWFFQRTRAGFADVL